MVKKITIPRSRHYRYSSVKKDSGKYPLLPESMSNPGENLGISQSSLCSLSSCNHGGLHSTWLCVHAFCVNSGTCIALTSFSAQVRYDRPIVIAMKMDSKNSPRWLLGPSALTAFPRCLLCFGTVVRFFWLISCFLPWFLVCADKEDMHQQQAGYCVCWCCLSISACSTSSIPARRTSFRSGCGNF